MVKKHQSDVIDRLKEEWCEFDDKVVDLSNSDKTYDWYVANELMYLQRNNSASIKVGNLGSDVIYNGALELQTNTTPPETVCTIRIKNEIQNEDVITICELEKKYGGKEYVQKMGILFDRDMNFDSGRLVRGNLNSGLVEIPDSGDGAYAFFVKDIGSGLNNINTAWVDYSVWSSSYNVA